MIPERFDVVIIGSGLAGLTLARHLLLHTDKTVLLLDKQANPPGSTQKVGESLVQLSGYYLSKILDLEEHLLTRHYLKYNLRFQWKTEGRSNSGLEDYSVSFIRQGSNIATFQLDRNLLEEHLFQLVTADPRCRFQGDVRNVEVDLRDNADHRVSFSTEEAVCAWVVDASGRGGVLKRKLRSSEPNPIRHGSTWCWVEGLVNIEKLTGRPRADVLLDPGRRDQGSYPYFLATNHFCGEGRWFWVIPLHGKTSLGLVYDHAVLDPKDVSNPRKMLDYACREWPLLARDLPYRKILDSGRYADYSYGAQQTISSGRWAMTGEAGRFSDPLYSPGSDLISIHNTLIADAVCEQDPQRLDAKCQLFERIMRVMYESYVPSYAVSYDCLGDQEAFTLKYAWELAVYFGFYVMPFINHRFASETVMPFLLLKYSVLGQINRNLQYFLSAFFQWKKRQPRQASLPLLFDFYRIGTLRESEKLFYEIGLTDASIESAIEQHVDRLKELARYILAHVHAVVLDDARLVFNARFVADLKLRNTVFEPDQMRANYLAYADCTETHIWNLDSACLEPFVLQAKSGLVKTT